MRVLNVSAIALACIVLSGCGTQKPVVPGEKETVNLDRRLLTECEQLPDLSGGEDDALNKFIASVVANQSACRKKHHGLVQEVKKAFNIE